MDPPKTGHDVGASKPTKRRMVQGCCKPITGFWTTLTVVVHHQISRFILNVSLKAARYPKQTISLITLVSFILIFTGYFTNYTLEVDYEKVYAPFNSDSLQHKEWIADKSGFPVPPRPFSVILHKNGNNVLGMTEIEHVFEALDTIRETPGYDSLCAQSEHQNMEGTHDCKIFGATQFWGHSADIFHLEIKSDDDAIKAMSAPTFPSGMPVYTEFLFGFAEREVVAPTLNQDGNHTVALLDYAKSYLLRIEIPEVEGAQEVEVEILDRLGDLQEKWIADEENDLDISYFTRYGYELEFKRAIDKDLILVPFMILVMSMFTCLVFYKRDSVQSRCLLGVGSVMTVGVSLMSGFGLLFIIGVPFTSMTQILPFVVFGIGLDDTFIITGAYFRTDPKKDTVERIRETMLEVGQSIALTTFTTILAFMLGCMSSIPSIRWVCIYAWPCIAIDFVYQVSFFIALLVLDERRIKANGRDCCIWSVVQQTENDDKSFKDGNDSSRKEDRIIKTSQSLAARFMGWYSKQLAKPWIKAVVIVSFTAYCGLCAYRTTLLKQQFRIQDFVPQGSYVQTFLEVLDEYNEQVGNIQVYFRHVNQSDAAVQQQMRGFINDLVAMPAVNGTDPLVCWVLDFENNEYESQYKFLANLTFSEKMHFALSNPAIEEAYGDNIVRDQNGEIVASRCFINPAELDIDSVRAQIDLLADQEAVTKGQPVNQGREEPAFFTFSSAYFIWEFYAVAVQELVFTTVSGVVAVCLIGFALIPHRSAILFVFPTIVVLYVDLLGTLQLAGLHINVVTYVCMVTSIGLLVDFLMHVTLRYYEAPGSTRQEKVMECLNTMGVSILIGGLSTLLGVIPLAFSTSLILRTVFIAFFAMVALGVAHGLILLPVLLSLAGPIVTVNPHNVDECECVEESSLADLELCVGTPVEVTALSDTSSSMDDKAKNSLSSSPSHSLVEAEEGSNVEYGTTFSIPTNFQKQDLDPQSGNELSVRDQVLLLVPTRKDILDESEPYNSGSAPSDQTDPSLPSPMEHEIEEKGLDNNCCCDKDDMMTICALNDTAEKSAALDGRHVSDVVPPPTTSSDGKMPTRQEECSGQVDKLERCNSLAKVDDQAHTSLPVVIDLSTTEITEKIDRALCPDGHESRPISSISLDDKNNVVEDSSVTVEATDDAILHDEEISQVSSRVETGETPLPEGQDLRLSSSISLSCNTNALLGMSDTCERNEGSGLSDEKIEARLLDSDVPEAVPSSDDGDSSQPGSVTGETCTTTDGSSDYKNDEHSSQTTSLDPEPSGETSNSSSPASTSDEKCLDRENETIKTDAEHVQCDDVEFNSASATATEDHSLLAQAVEGEAEDKNVAISDAKPEREQEKEATVVNVTIEQGLEQETHVYLVTTEDISAPSMSHQQPQKLTPAEIAEARNVIQSRHSIDEDDDKSDGDSELDGASRGDNMPEGEEMEEEEELEVEQDEEEEQQEEEEQEEEEEQQEDEKQKEDEQQEAAKIQ